MWPACSPLVSRASFVRGYWTLDLPGCHLCPFVCRTGYEKDPFGTISCVTISQQPSSHLDDQVAINLDRSADDERNP